MNAVMPRPLRIQYAGARYHVMSRGDRREAIFYDDADRVEFPRTLGQACLKSDRLRIGVPATSQIYFPVSIVSSDPYSTRACRRDDGLTRRLRSAPALG
jgi:hypothetical protein